MQNCKARFCVEGKEMHSMPTKHPNQFREEVAYCHMISLSFCFSSSLSKMVSMATRARSHISSLSRLKCSAIRAYSFERVLPKTPTSSVYIYQHKCAGQIQMQWDATYAQSNRTSRLPPPAKVMIGIRACNHLGMDITA
jgi:hypothetical protein